MVFQRVRFTLPCLLPAMRWALTPPFHPYQIALAVYFLWHCLSADRHQPAAFPLGSMLPYAARTFLPVKQSDRTACCGKDRQLLSRKSNNKTIKNATGLLYLLFLSIGPMSSLINFHTHHPSAEALAIINVRASETKQPGMSQYFSVGIHPWDVHLPDLQAQWAYVEKMSAKPEVVMIGEAGLDLTSRASLSVQAEIFERHCQLAETLQKPLIIHCVRAFSELIQIRKQRKTTVPWIIHGFNANPEIARQLQKYDFYFSLGSALLRSESNASHVLNALPENRFFLETDDADSSIQSIYRAASEILTKPEELLKEEVFTRFRILFSKQLP